jgi:hypothetical protein
VVMVGVRVGDVVVVGVNVGWGARETSQLFPR